MPKIPVVSTPLRTTSLSHGYFQEMVWPADMEEERRKIWSKILAQAIGPLRTYLKDTTCPSVVPGNVAEQELQDARLETEEKRLEVFKLVTRVTELELSVGKRMEELEKVAGHWATAAEAQAELDLIFVKNKLEKVRQYRREHNMAAPSQHVRSSGCQDVAVGGAPGPSVQSGPVIEATETAGEGRGRDQEVSRGSRVRYHSPLMIPVVWGFTRDAPTGMLPKEVLHEYMAKPHEAIIRRSTPDAHPKFRLLAPHLEGLAEYAPKMDVKGV